MSIKLRINTWTLWNINKPSFLMVLLPYIGFNWRELYESPFYSLGQAGLVILVLIAIELVFVQLIKKTGKYEQVLSVLFICFSILFFYGNDLVVPVNEFIIKSFHLFIKEKIVFIVIAILLLIFIYYIIAWILNLSWSPLFFTYKMTGASFIVILLMVIFIFLTIKEFYLKSKLSGYILLPYLIWVSFASYLNGYIYVNN
jgi:tryptophan-rich sensory protein